MSTEQNSTQQATIRIPHPLYMKVAERLAGSIFNSVDEWVVKLIEGEFEMPRLPESDEARIRNRLKLLGYE